MDFQYNINAHASRYKVLLQKYSGMYVLGHRLSGIIGRFVGPKVIINSLPKAGTHLLEATLLNFPLMRRRIIPTQNAWPNLSEKTIASVRSLSCGQFMAAHFAYFDQLEKQLIINNIKIIMVIRDPRDILVSYYKYVTEIDRTHRLHRFFSSLEDDHARLNAAIDGSLPLFSPFSAVLEGFSPWLNSPCCHIVRFEDLIGEAGGGSGGQQRETIEKIADYLNIPISSKVLNHICSRTFNTSAATFRAGQVGAWKAAFNDESIGKFNLTCSQAALKYGYK